MEHESHRVVANRLKRTQGHLRKVIDMLETGAPCVEMAQQLFAVERAIRAAKSTLIHDHVDHCLADAAEDPQTRKAQIAEFKDITRYL
jgi:DNA-binding FrmR family transcriptional regulator